MCYPSCYIKPPHVEVCYHFRSVWHPILIAVPTERANLTDIPLPLLSQVQQLQYLLRIPATLPPPVHQLPPTLDKSWSSSSTPLRHPHQTSRWKISIPPTTKGLDGDLRHLFMEDDSFHKNPRMAATLLVLDTSTNLINKIGDDDEDPKLDLAGNFVVLYKLTHHHFW